MAVGDRIKKLRKEHNLTQEELAKKINTTKQNIYKYENNIVTNIPSDKIELMAKIFQVSPSYLMGWNEKSQNLCDEMNELFRHYEFIAGGTVFNSFVEILQKLNTISELFETAICSCNMKQLTYTGKDPNIEKALSFMATLFSEHNDVKDEVISSLKVKAYKTKDEIITILDETVDSLWNFVEAYYKSNSKN